ncbi:MAG: hypothetical protein J6T98_00680 [Salinivirgaceae bacterium]|nr:hypothetical protein [Salinivirgaceae bacterium]
MALAITFGCCNQLHAQKRHSNVESVEVFEEDFNKDGTSKKQKISESKFDSFGNEIETIEYENGKVSEKHVYTYDDKGNKISELKTESDGKKERIEYKYNDDNLRIEKSVYSEKGRLKSRKTYIYKMK